MKYIINCYDEVMLRAYKDKLGSDIDFLYKKKKVKSNIEKIENNEVTINIKDKILSKEIYNEIFFGKL